MNTNPTDPIPMTPLLEGAEEPIQEASQYLESLGIHNSITLAEDCKPGS